MVRGEFTPVETETTVTLPQGDRVWSWKQEAPRLQLRSSSRNIGLIKVGLVQPEFTPVETATSGLRGIYPYRQMSVVEAGSPEASAEG